MAQAYLSLLPRARREKRIEDSSPAFQNVLCSVDSLDAEETVVEYADSLAARFAARLTLLHWAPLSDVKPALSKLSPAGSSGYGPDRKRTIRIGLESYPGEGVAGEILRLARSERFDLIVMPLARGLFRGPAPAGLDAAKVMRAVKCPVITCGDFHAQRRGLFAGCVLCAVDFAPRSARALRFAAALAQGFRAPLAVVHATGRLSNPVEGLMDSDGKLTARGILTETIVRLLDEAGADGEVAVEAGETHEVVARTARRLGARLVVVGRGAKGGLFSRLYPRAPAISRLAPCPVVSV